MENYTYPDFRTNIKIQLLGNCYSYRKSMHKTNLGSTYNWIYKTCMMKIKLVYRYRTCVRTSSALCRHLAEWNVRDARGRVCLPLLQFARNTVQGGRAAACHGEGSHARQLWTLTVWKKIVLWLVTECVPDCSAPQIGCSDWIAIGSH